MDYMARGMMGDMSKHDTCNEPVDHGPNPEYDQIIVLDNSNSWSGCDIVGDLYVCDGEKQFYSLHPRPWSIGLMQCAGSVEINITISSPDGSGTLESCLSGSTKYEGNAVVLALVWITAMSLEFIPMLL